MGWPEKITQGPIFRTRYFAKKWIDNHGIHSRSGSWHIKPVNVYESLEDWKEDNDA